MTLYSDFTAWVITVHLHTICPGSGDPFYILTYYIKLVTTSWTHRTSAIKPVCYLATPVMIYNYSASNYY